MLKKIGLITIADAITKGVGYLLLPVYLGLMTQREFGEFSFIFIAISPLSMFVGLSLYASFIRNFCSHKSSHATRKELVSTVFNSLFIWLIIIDVLFLLAKPLLINAYIGFFNVQGFADEKYYLIFLLINTGAVLLYCYSLLMSRKNSQEIVVFMLVKFSLVSVISLVFMYFNLLGHESVLNRLSGIFIAELVVALAYIFIYVRPYISLKINLSVLRDQFKIALPLIPLGLMGLFIVIIDRGLIAEYHGLEELANYNLAMMALLPIQMLMSATQVAWAPHLFSLKGPKDAMRQTIKVMMIALLIMIIGAGLLSLAIYLALFYNFIGTEYEVVPEIIIYSSIGVIASALIHLNSNMFVYLKKTNFQLVIGLVILVINWNINIALIPDYSFYGAAIAAGVSNVIGLAVGIIILKKITNSIVPQQIKTTI
jgi:O-antigen/teichoic acid export membrane protein